MQDLLRSGEVRQDQSKYANIAQIKWYGRKAIPSKHYFLLSILLLSCLICHRVNIIVGQSAKP